MLTLTNDQNNALIKLKEWISDRNKSKVHNFFSLVGSAGTGKTTLINYFLVEAQKIIGSSICISAPTHKAKREIEKKTSWKYSETLQKLLGMKLDVLLEMFDINNPSFSIMDASKMEEYKLIIIDESSMINKDLYELICKIATQYSNNIKVLFIGDLCQLPPVNEYQYSKSLTEPINSYELTEIVRQNNDNPLLNLLTILRDDIKNSTELYIPYLKEKQNQQNTKGEGYYCLNSNDYSEKIKHEFSSKHFKINYNYVRFLTWTNINVENTNKWIRKNVFNFDNQFNEGEVLFSYKTITEDDKPIIFNSDDYIVKSIDLNKEDDILVKKVNLFNTSLDNNISINFVDLHNQQNVKDFIEIFKDELNTAKRLRTKKGWVKFYEFKDSFLLTNSLFFNNQILCKKDFDYGYSLTIHKAQGSTYNTVFVNLKELSKNPNQFERTRMLYVALSRASNKVYINI